MCGIAGIFTPSPWRDSHDRDLAAMQAALRHRGPDDEGIWTHPESGVGLAHTRLSILDLSSAGHQPMVSDDKRYVITFNGEIYNFRKLRSSLEKAGHCFHTQTDTEVLLRLYAQKGPAMLDDLRGMFAFCIWDAREQSAFLARDPLGIKPLYYSDGGGCLRFASEVKALRALSDLPTELDEQAVIQYLETGSVPEPLTLLRSIRSLQAGHFLTLKNLTLSKPVRYWTLDFTPQPQSHETAMATTRAALTDSIQRHLVSDVPVGVFLSGGIDSTVLVALASQVLGRGMSSFSIGVDDQQLDESGVAKQTADHFGTQHHEMRLTATTGRALFEQFLHHMDQPTIDGFNTFTVSDFARREGYKVVLSGLGGDELFGGYPSFHQVPNLARAGRWAHIAPPLAQGIGRILEQRAKQPKWRRLGGFLTQEPSIHNAYRCFRGVFSPTEARRIAFEYTSATHLNPHPSPITSQHSSSIAESDAVSELEFTRYMRNQLLKDSDVFSMASGLELRVPFVDKRLVETVGAIPCEARLQRGKALLLSAVPEVPQWVQNQAKRGFVFPFDKWLMEDWGSEFTRATQRIPFANPTWYQRWAVFMLDQWLAHS